MLQTSVDKYVHLFKPLDTTVNEVDVVNSYVLNCNDCNLPATTHGRGLWECSNCGGIVDQILDNVAEWKSSGDGSRQDSVRCGAVHNMLLPQSSQGTIMLSTNSSSYGMMRSQKVHSWSCMTYKERSLNNIFKDITLRSLNGCILDNVTKLAHEYYKITSEFHVARGLMRKGLIAACLFMACKKKGVPRTCQEIAEIFNINDKWVTRGKKKFVELWNLAGKEHITYKEECQSSDYLARLCSNLMNNHFDLLRVSREISSLCKTHDILPQSTPISISAACIYMATFILKINETITRVLISEVAKTSQVTISKCFKQMNLHPKVWKTIE
jgi:transcription initiation factor TFIIB